MSDTDAWEDEAEEWECVVCGCSIFRTPTQSGDIWSHNVKEIDANHEATPPAEGMDLCDWCGMLFDEAEDVMSYAGYRYHAACVDLAREVDRICEKDSS